MQHKLVCHSASSKDYALLYLWYCIGLHRYAWNWCSGTSCRFFFCWFLPFSRDLGKSKWLHNPMRKVNMSHQLQFCVGHVTSLRLGTLCRWLILKAQTGKASGLLRHEVGDGVTRLIELQVLLSHWLCSVCETSYLRQLWSWQNATWLHGLASSDRYLIELVYWILQVLQLLQFLHTT